MAQSQIRQPSQEELLRALTAGNTEFDPTQAARGTIAGQSLAETVLKGKQGQEDRVRALQEKIKAAKLEREQRGRVEGFRQNPSLETASTAFADKGAEYEFAKALQEQKNKAARDLMKNKPVKAGNGLLPGQIAADKKFGEEFVQFETGGGKQAAETGLNKLAGSVTSLEGLQKQSGTKKLLKRVANAVLPEKTVGLATPGLQELSQDLRSNVLGSLRATLGPQFTEREGERIFKQTFDPTLDPSVNAKRAKALQTELNVAFKAKQAAAQYFRQHQTLAGFKGLPASIGGVPVTAADFGLDESTGNPGESENTGDAGGLTPEEAQELAALEQIYGGQ